MFLLRSLKCSITFSFVSFNIVRFRTSRSSSVIFSAYAVLFASASLSFGLSSAKCGLESAGFGLGLDAREDAGGFSAGKEEERETHRPGGQAQVSFSQRNRYVRPLFIRGLYSRGGTAMTQSTKGTKNRPDMWCPECKKVRVCKAIPSAQVNSNTKGYGRRRHSTKYKDIRWFQRGRVCQSCGHNFLTIECSKEFILELIELRDTVSGIKSNAESYISESGKASKSLEKLNKSLSDLEALEIQTGA